MSGKTPSRELSVGAVVFIKSLAEARRWDRQACHYLNPKGIVMTRREAPPEHPNWGPRFRVERLDPDRVGRGRRPGSSHWYSEQDLVVLGRVRRLPVIESTSWGEWRTADRLSLAPGNRVRIADTGRCGTVISISRKEYMSPGHRAVVAFDDGGEEEFFSGVSFDGKRLVRGGCGPDLVDPLNVCSYGTTEEASVSEYRQERELARSLHQKIYREPRLRRMRYSTDPHERCKNAGYCVEHELQPGVEPCDCGAA